MIQVKLQTIAKQLNKTITDIAHDTGLNRNTITALYHNQVDGIKFGTIEQICKTYRLKLNDLIEMQIDAERRSDFDLPPKLYKQEGSIVPFTCWPWVMAITQPDQAVFSDHYSILYAYFQRDYGMGYWDYYNMQRVSQGVYRRYNSPKDLELLFQIFLPYARSLEAAYRNLDIEALLQMSASQVRQFSDGIWDQYRQFWVYSLFIDSFDAGFDQEQIQIIAKKYDLTIDEIVVLTTPQELAFTNERYIELLKIAKRLSRHKSLGMPTVTAVKEVIAGDEGVAEYIKAFDYYKSNYAHISHITLEETAEELTKYLLDKDLLTAELHRLEQYSAQQIKKQKAVLRKHRLTHNPLEFFAKLTFWREYRKQVNLKGIHVLDGLLQALQKQTGIPYRYLQYLSFEEVDAVLKGLVSLDVLKKRCEQGGLVIIQGNSYKMIEGDEASSLRDDLEEMLNEANEDPVVIPGNIASQGYARGVAKVILDRAEFDKLEEGEILVTGMTRPEFVPVMKKAAGIVTNEGGITCHAAIVSRELGKPCIIGTKNATQLIHDGDLIEVRANHGSVRILKRA
ncbi:MAG TPA: PEP-utilizing enzyme [Patescibacteria group bacterium]